MRNSTKIVLAIAIVATVAGALLKINENKVIGDSVLVIGILAWIYIIYTVIMYLTNQKKV